MSADDGRFVLNNGKHIVAALKELKAAYPDLDALAEEAWCVGDLECTFREGFYVDFVEYPEDDRDSQVAMQVFAHEQDQNKYQPSSIADKVSITMRLFKRTNDWSITQKTLVSILGAGKGSTCYRWVCLARDLHPDVLAHIKQHRKHMLANYVVDNKFLLGRGESARFKLSVPYAKTSLDRLFDALDAGKAVSAKDFANDYCMVFKQLETWEKQQVAKFGKVAKYFPAFQRVLRSLQSEAGRQKLMVCMSQRLPISGSDSTTQYGIEEARAVVVEMQKMKAGSDPTKHGEQQEGSGSGVSLPGSGVSLQEDQGGVPASGSGVSLQEEQDSLRMDIDDGDLLVEDNGPLKDPVMEKATTLMEAESDHITIHTSRSDFEKDVQTRVLKSHKPIIVIEAPSSKPRVFHDLLKFADSLDKLSASYFIPVGCRTELLSTVVAALGRAHPKRIAYVVQLGYEPQTQRTRSSFAVYMPATVKSGVAVPCFVSLSGCRAKAMEGLRLRCVDPKCPMRGEGDSVLLEDPEAADGDLHVDDQEFADFDPRDTVEEEEADEADLAVEMDQDGPSAAGKFKRNLFPFASPVAVHSRVFHQILRGSSCSHVLVLTRSAHPGLYIAARECKLECIALLEGAKEHCVAHGRELLRKMLIAKHYRAAKEAVSMSKSVKRVQSSSVPFIVLNAPPESDQIIHMREVEPDQASAWRSGFNKSPRNMEDKLLNLLQKELFDHSMYLEKKDNVMALFTHSARREGEVLCPLRSLLFDAATALEGFLSEGGNKVFSDRLVRVDGCILAPSGGVSPVYVALVGVGRFLSHFAGVRKSGPNAKIEVNCGAGAGDGFLSLVVSTRNGVGIAARSQIVINFGNEFDLQFKPDLEEPDAKRFRGVLEKYFNKSAGQASGVDLAGGVPKRIDEEEAKNTKDAKDEEVKKEEEEEEHQEEQEEQAQSEAEEQAREEAEAEEPKKEEAAMKKGEEAKNKKDKQAKKNKKVQEAKQEAADKKEEAPKQEKEGTANGSADAGATELASLQHPFNFKVLFQEAEPGKAAARLQIVQQTGGNKKLYPKKLLWVLRSGNGSIRQVEEEGVPSWSFTSTKTPLGPIYVGSVRFVCFIMVTIATCAPCSLDVERILWLVPGLSAMHPTLHYMSRGRQRWKLFFS